MITRILILTSLVFFLGACKSKEDTTTQASQKSSSQIQAVLVQKISASVQKSSLLFSAELRGGEDAQLVTSTGGKVLKVPQIGSKVKKGDSLCDIDSEKYEALFRQAEAGKNLASDEKNRIKDNVNKGSLGQAALQKAELDYWTAEVGFRNALTVYQESKCRSPFDGVVVSRQLEKHQTLMPGSPTVRIASLSSVEVVFFIPENNQFDVAVGMPIEFLGSSGKSLKGTINRIDQAIDVRNRTLMATALINNPGQGYHPGAMGQVKVTPEAQRGLWVPVLAVQREGALAKVAVVKNGTVKFVPVVVGPLVQNSILIKSGLNEGDDVVSEGAFKLEEGDSIQAIQQK